MQAPLPCRGDTRVVCADIGYRHSSATLACLFLPMPHYASQACRYHSIAAGGRCCWHTPLRLCLRERFTLLTLMPTRAFHSADAMLLVLHRQSTRATSAAQRCSALRASRRRLSGDAGASSGAGSLMPHRHPSFLLQHRVSVPQSASIAARRPRRYASGWRAANQHGTQPDGASRSPTYPPLCDDGFAYRFPQNTHCFSSWTRRTATTNHCADILCRHSRLQGECRP